MPPLRLTAPTVIPPTMPPPARVEVLDQAVRDGADDPRVRALALTLRRMLVRGIGREPTGLELVQWLLDCQHDLVQYTPDPPGEEVFQPVTFTLFCECSETTSVLTGRRRGTGDCEDLAASVCSLGLVNGLLMRTKWWDQPGALLNHVAGLACDTSARRCIDVEATIPGARPGESPYQSLARIGPGFRSRLFGTNPAGLSGPGGVLQVTGIPDVKGWEIDGVRFPVTAAAGALAAPAGVGVHVVRVFPRNGADRVAVASVPVQGSVSVPWARMHVESYANGGPAPSSPQGI